MRVARLLAVLLVRVDAVARPVMCRADASANASVVVTAQFGSRTALKVSTELLQFDVTTAHRPAVAVDVMEIDAIGAFKHHGRRR